MPDESPAQIVYDAIQSTHNTDEDLDGSVLLGFIAIAEWSDPKGARWLSKMTQDVSGNAASQWAIQGWLHNALYDWPNDAPED